MHAMGINYVSDVCSDLGVNFTLVVAQPSMCVDLVLSCNSLHC